jgi:hypothetical protein
MTADDLFAELRREFKRGLIREAPIRDKLMHVDGLCDHDNGTIYVDPAPAVVSTLLHELIHRAHPRWGEKRVTKAEAMLLGQMRSADVQKWYRQYRAAVKRLRKPVNSE